MADLEIFLLGPFQACLNGTLITGFESVKVRALLAYLAAEADRPHRREALATLLWSDWPQQSAMNNLRYALADLRKNIADRDANPPFLLISRESLQLNQDADIWVDVSEFISVNPIASSQNLAAILPLYRGSFLEGFNLADSVPFDDWLLARQEYFSQQVQIVLQSLCDQHERSGEYGQAQTYVQRQIDLEPWREEAHQQLMRLLAFQGQRSSALAQFEKCRRALKDGLGVEPGTETVAIYNHIREGNLSPEKDRETPPPVEKLTVTQDQPAFPASSTQPLQSNLPLQMTSFIGREKEIAAVCRLLFAHRLVTLTGSGGTGKTRLSLQVARLVMENYPNGVWLVELAPLVVPELIPKTMASALNLPEIPGKTVREALVDYLRPKHLLLILDNCEHLLEACGELADTLLHACPELTILASSREFLGVEGEVPYRVPPMTLPDPKQLPSLETLSDNDSVHLFIERSRVVSPDFTITESNAANIIQVVARLDGIPLAIELAASRLSLLGIDQLLQRLNDAFRLLTGGSRSKLPRHQTLRACIDWSYNLLSEPERILLRRLSVFAGGWRLQAAEQVCANELENCQPLCPDDILDLLSELVDKSLIFTVGVTDGLNRFKMLETVRQYSHEKLVNEKEAEVFRTRHLAYYLSLADRLAPKIHGPEQIETLDLLEIELDNLRLALEWALQTDIEAELRLAYALWWFWHIRSLWSEGIDWLERGRELAQRHPPTFLEDYRRAILYARALTALGFFYKMFMTTYYNQHTDSNQAKEYLEESVRIYRSLDLEKNPGFRRDLAWALQTLGSYYGIVTNIAQAKACVQESLRLFRETGDLHGIDEGLQELGECEVDLLRRLQYHKEQLSVAQASGDTERIAAANTHIGFDCFANGNYREAFHAFQHSSRQFSQVNNPIMAAWGCLMLGWSTLYIGDLPRANELISQAQVSYRDLGVENRVAFSLILKCLPALAEGKYQETAGLIDEALGIYRQTSIREDDESMFIRTRLARLIGDTFLARQLAEELVNSEDASDYAKVWGAVELGHLELQKGDLKQALASIRDGLQIYLRAQDHLSTTDILFDALALLAARQKWMEYAARLFGSRWCRGHAHLLSPVERAWREADWSAMQDELGEVRFDELYEEGKQMSFDHALKLAQEVCGA